MRGVTKQGVQDTLAVLGFGALIAGCIFSVWWLAVMVACWLGCAAIEMEIEGAPARQYRKKQRAARMGLPLGVAMVQPEPTVQMLPIYGRAQACGCVYVPEQLVRCPADAALAEVEGIAEGHA